MIWCPRCKNSWLDKDGCPMCKFSIEDTGELIEKIKELEKSSDETADEIEVLEMKVEKLKKENEVFKKDNEGKDGEIKKLKEEIEKWRSLVIKMSHDCWDE